MALFQILYMSALIANDTKALPAILEASVRNNQRKNLTGMLLYADGGILQVLEGEKDTVLETFRTIQQDTRHQGVIVLIEKDIAARQFVSWSMGFKHLSKAELEKFPAAAQIFKAHRNEIAARVEPSDALIVLQTFAEDVH